MITVRELLAAKGSQILSIGPDASVLDAALLMNEHKVGCVVVLDAGALAGIFTERDVMRRVVAERRDPATTRICDVMSCEVVCCRPETTMEEASGVLKNRRIRHLPVADDERRLLGLISIGDLNARQAHEQEHTIHVLQEYINGRC